GRLPVCVVDCGTGHTKLGHAGNTEPQFIIPSCIAIKETAKVGDQAQRRVMKDVDELDFFIGDEAIEKPTYATKWPIRHEFANPDFTQPISEVVDDVIQNSLIDVRRPLYKNIVLSGGSTMFRDFGHCLQRDLKRTVDARLKLCEELNGGRLMPKPIDVQAITHHMQQYAVWFGGSMLASTPEFYQVCHTEKDYEEIGPSIGCDNPEFGVMS
ncbi:Actin-related protein 3, partial [Heterocephalus glaber]